MRFRQACSIIAQAIEAVEKLRPNDSDFDGALCGTIDLAVHPGLTEEGAAQHGMFYEWRLQVARLLRMAGITQEHVDQLRVHIQSELRSHPGLRTDDARLTTKWQREGKFGLPGPDVILTPAEKRAARCAWLRTLGRTAPAKAVHAPE